MPLANRRAEKTIAIVFQIRLQLVRAKITFQSPASKICEKKSTLPTRQESETEIKFSCLGTVLYCICRNSEQLLSFGRC